MTWLCTCSMLEWSNQIGIGGIPSTPSTNNLQHGSIECHLTNLQP